MLIENLPPKIVVLGTGGTIAGRSPLVNDNIGYTAAQVDIESLSSAIPGLKNHVSGFVLDFEQVAQVDSKDMDFKVWTALIRRVAEALAAPEVRGIVITHGTDTIEETAFFLHSVLQCHKPVVFTCAMRPASALNPDGPQNILDALSVVMNAQASGVVVVCAGAVHTAERVQKIHPYRLDAFSSGEAGPCGWIEEGRVRWVTDPLCMSTPSSEVPVISEGLAWPQVEIVLNHVGATGAVVDALVGAGVHGLVVACTGNGTMSQSLTQALLRAQAAGVQVVRSTRCPYGRVVSLPDATFPDAQGLSPVKARIAMLLSLMRSAACH